MFATKLEKMCMNLFHLFSDCRHLFFCTRMKANARTVTLWLCCCQELISVLDELQGASCGWLIYQNDVPTWIRDVNQKSSGVFIGKWMISISLTSWGWCCAMKQVLKWRIPNISKKTASLLLLTTKHHFYFTTNVRFSTIYYTSSHPNVQINGTGSSRLSSCILWQQRSF